MRPCLLFATALFCLTTHAPALAGTASTQQLNFVGNALDPETNELIYREYHSVLLDEQANYLKSETRYLDQNGNLIATKSVDYRQGEQHAPSIRFDDLRHESFFQVKNHNESLFVEAVTPNTSANDNIALQEHLVIDQGFDRYIHQNWQILESGKTLNVQFLIPKLQKTIDMRIRPTSITNDAITFHIDIDNFIYRLFTNPIVLQYDRQQQRIVTFSGMTNLQKVEGKGHYVANIEYQYLDSSELTHQQESKAQLSSLTQ